MRLAEWVNQHGDRQAARARIAKVFSLTEVAVRHWCNGTRRVPPERCMEIGAFTGGMVTARELRPDVFGPRAESTDSSPKAVAERLAEAIRVSGVRKTELAEAVGVSPQAITGWLHTGKIARGRISAITKVLRCSSQWLLDGEPGLGPHVLGPDAKTLRLAEAIQSLPPEARNHLQAITAALAKAV